MKVVHLITGLSTGGAERGLYNVLSEDSPSKNSAVVVSLRDEGTYGPRIRALGVPVFTLGVARSLPGLFSISRLRQLVKELQPDVIQGWMYHGNIAATVAGWLSPGLPAVAWNIRHSLYSLAEEKPLTRQVIKANRRLSSRADAIVYNSRLSRRQHEAYGLSADKARVIPNGFDLEQFRPSVFHGRDLRREHGVPAEARLIGHVARFHPMKDHAGFVRAAVSVAQRFEDVQVMLAGRQVTEDNETLRNLVPDALRNRFHFLGECQDVTTLMQAMDIFCQSSWSEAFPNVLGEAMACQTPCVVTDVGDSAGIVADTGIVVPPRDREALVAGLTAMLSKSAAERRALGQAARARVESNYALPRIVAQYANLYEQLANGF